MFESVSKIFNPTPQPQQQSATQLPQQQTVQPAQGPNTAPQGVVPNDPNNPNKGTPNDENANKSPLDSFADLWQTKPKDPNAPANATESMEIDAEQLHQHVAKLSFTDSISQDTLQKIAAGGEDAVSALVEVVNAVGRNVLAQSTLVGNKLAQRVATHEAKNLQGSLESRIKAMQLSSNLVEANPLFNNPAVKPVIDSVKDQLVEKFPDATSAELTKMAQEFVIAMSTALNPNATQQQQNQQQQGDDQNWDKFLAGLNPGQIS